MEYSDDENEVAFLSHLLSGVALPEDPFGGVDSSWKEVEIFETVVAIDDVDIELLSVAREEVKVVLDHLVTKMFGQKPRVRKKITPGQILKVFLPSNILSTIRAQINQHIASPTLQSDKLAFFIQIELLLSCYGRTPTSFFNIDNRELYPAAS